MVEDTYRRRLRSQRFAAWLFGFALPAFLPGFFNLAFGFAIDRLSLLPGVVVLVRRDARQIAYQIRRAGEIKIYVWVEVKKRALIFKASQGIEVGTRIAMSARGRTTEIVGRCLIWAMTGFDSRSVIGLLVGGGIGMEGREEQILLVWREVKPLIVELLNGVAHVGLE